MYNQGGTEKISDNKKICIIGAGASGLAAAISASRAGAEVCVLEHKKEAGNKLLLTGNGKCNFTNLKMNSSCYHQNEDSRISCFLKRFTPEDAISFFEGLGIKSSEKCGYVYPESGNASDIREALIRAAGNIKTESVITDVISLRKKYDAIILACGSFAARNTGSDGSGYKMLEQLKIKYTRVLPALCSLRCDTAELMKHFPGKRFAGRINVYDGKKIIGTDCGEIQLRDNAISGIPVMNISRYVSRELYYKGQTKPNDEWSGEVKIEILPVSEFELPEIIRCRNEKPVFIDSSVELTVRHISRFSDGQICTGGVPLEELDDNLQLRNSPGIYVTGEMCDVDGICGGYNLHWAWLSGILAGKAAAI